MGKKNIAIIGLGLLGTSLAMALKGKFKILGWARRKESLDYALQTGVCDQVFSNTKDILSIADITVLCLPVKTIISFASENVPYFKKNSIVTDIGSVKRKIVRDLEPLLSRHSVNFLGSHPMAGSEQSGAEAARDGIYRNALVFITPTENTNSDALASVKQVWKLVGAKTKIISPELHDKTVALSSHLVHLSAVALAGRVLSNDNSSSLIADACAGGFRDSTRIAMSEPRMWNEIIEFNSDNLIPLLKNLEDDICEIRKSLEDKNFDKLLSIMDEAKKLRTDWQLKRQYENI